MDWNALGPHGLADERGRRARPVRPGLRALRHARSPSSWPPTWPSTPPGLTDPVSYGTPASQRPAHPPLRRGHPRPAAQPGVDGPPGLLHGRPIPAPSSGPSRPPTPWWSTATPPASSTPPRSGCWPATRPSSTPAPWTPTRRCERTTLGQPADLVVTDTNRKQGYAWNSLNENTGYTETAAQGPGHHRPDRRPAQPLPQGPGRRPDHRRPARGVLGHRLVLRLLDHLPARGPAGRRPRREHPDRLAGRLLRPASSASGGRWSWPSPAPTSSLVLVQPQTGDPDRTITRATLTFDGGHPVTVALGPASLHARRPAGHLSGPDLHHPAHHRRPAVARGRSRRRRSDRAARSGSPRWASPASPSDEIDRHARGPAAGGRAVVRSPTG